MSRQDLEMRPSPMYAVYGRMHAPAYVLAFLPVLAGMPDQA